MFLSLSLFYLNWDLTWAVCDCTFTFVGPLGNDYFTRLYSKIALNVECEIENYSFILKLLITESMSSRIYLIKITVKELRMFNLDEKNFITVRL